MITLTNSYVNIASDAVLINCIVKESVTDSDCTNVISPTFGNCSGSDNKSLDDTAQLLSIGTQDTVIDDYFTFKNGGDYSLNALGLIKLGSGFSWAVDTTLKTIKITNSQVNIAENAGLRDCNVITSVSDSVCVNVLSPTFNNCTDSYCVSTDDSAIGVGSQNKNLLTAYIHSSKGDYRINQSWADVFLAAKGLNNSDITAWAYVFKLNIDIDQISLEILTPAYNIESLTPIYTIEHIH